MLTLFIVKANLNAAAAHNISFIFVLEVINHFSAKRVHRFYVRISVEFIVLCTYVSERVNKTGGRWELFINGQCLHYCSSAIIAIGQLELVVPREVEIN